MIYSDFKELGQFSKWDIWLREEKMDIGCGKISRNDIDKLKSYEKYDMKRIHLLSKAKKQPGSCFFWVFDVFFVYMFTGYKKTRIPGLLNLFCFVKLYQSSQMYQEGCHIGFLSLCHKDVVTRSRFCCHL